jgi:tripartite-type tricarboxylate transporter receptor subunit TctC
VNGFESVAWQGLFAPAGTPKPIVDTIHQAAAKFMAKPETKEQLVKMSLDAAPLAPEEFSAYIKAEIAKWARDAQEAGLKPE